MVAIPKAIGKGGNVKDYVSFVSNKLTRHPPTGLAVVPDLVGDLFPFQRDLTSWALRRGRAAIFAATGLGKMRMELSWAHALRSSLGHNAIILTPLAVASQMAKEAQLIGIDVTVCKDETDVRPGINIVNYDRMHRIDLARFKVAALDESSCIKHSDSKTFAALTKAFADTPFKLCGTATPAPNDWTELGTHAEFLGVCTRPEMLAEYYCHDGGETQKWRLKKHARSAYWRWAASWAALVRHPRDLGYEQDGYDLPPLNLHQHTIAGSLEDARASGLLFPMPAKSLSERRSARKGTIDSKIKQIVSMVCDGAEGDEPWVIWCELNAEQDALEEALGYECVSVHGSLDSNEKEARHSAWLKGEKRVMLSKASVFGWGLNWQHCARVGFVGPGDSWEAYHQAVRRCWRFGQKRAVDVHLWASELEGNVLQNLARKDAAAQDMAASLAAETADYVRAEVSGSTRETNAYDPRVTMRTPAWLNSEV